MKGFKKISLWLVIFMILQLIVIAPNAFALENSYSDYSIFLRDLKAINYPESITISSSTKSPNMATYNKYKLVVYGNLGEYSSKKDINGEYEYLGWNKAGQAQPNSWYQGTGSGSEGFNQVSYVSTDMNGNSITNQAISSWSNLKSYVDYNLNEQLLYNGSLTGVSVKFISQDKAILLQPATLISDGSVRVYFTSKDGSNKRYATLTIPAIPYKNITSCQINSDENLYEMTSDKDDIDVSIGASAFVNPKSNNFTNVYVFGLTARITSLEINGIEVASAYKVPPTFDDNYYGVTTIQKFQVDTGLKPLNLKRSQLVEGDNTITLKGYASMNTFNNLNDTAYGTKTFKITVDKKLAIPVEGQLDGQIITDKSSYTCKSTDTSVLIQAKEQTNLTIDDIAEITEIGAKVVTYSVNDGMDIAINKVKNGSSVKSIETDYAPINLNVGSLKNGDNTVTIKGYSWWKNTLGTLKEVNTTKTVIVTKTSTAEEVNDHAPIATIITPNNDVEVNAGETLDITGKAYDKDVDDVLKYKWEIRPYYKIEDTLEDGTYTPTKGTSPQFFNSGNIKFDKSIEDGTQYVAKFIVTDSTNKTSSDEKIITVRKKLNNPPKAMIDCSKEISILNDVFIEAGGSDINKDDKLNYKFNIFYGKNHKNHKELELFTQPIIKTDKPNPYSDFLPVMFTEPGEYILQNIVDDGELSDTVETIINVIEPIPILKLAQKGTLKENRKFTVYMDKVSSGASKVEMEWSKTEWTISSNEDIKDLKTLTSNKIVQENGKEVMKIIGDIRIIDFVSKSSSVYTLSCIVTNSFNHATKDIVTIDISLDVNPIANYILPSKIYRDPNIKDENGKAVAVWKLTDDGTKENGSYSLDKDTIVKRVWIACFDSDNDGSFEYVTRDRYTSKPLTQKQYEKWYVYDLNCNDNTSTYWKPNVLDNNHWRAVNSIEDVKNLDIDTINSGNLQEINLYSNHVGGYSFILITKEEFGPGQETIDAFVTIKDRKSGTSFSNEDLIN